MVLVTGRRRVSSMNETLKMLVDPELPKYLHLVIVLVLDHRSHIYADKFLGMD